MTDKDYHSFKYSHLHNQLEKPQTGCRVNMRKTHHKIQEPFKSKMLVSASSLSFCGAVCFQIKVFNKFTRTESMTCTNLEVNNKNKNGRRKMIHQIIHNSKGATCILIIKHFIIVMLSKVPTSSFNRKLLDRRFNQYMSTSSILSNQSEIALTLI